MDEVDEKDHLLVLADFEERKDLERMKDFDITTINGVASNFGGLVAYVNADYFSGPWDRYIGNMGARTAAHEFGHLAGLKHEHESDNLMKQNAGSRWYSSATKLTPKQIGNIHQDWKEGKLNLGFNRNEEHVISPSKGILIRKVIPYRGTADRILKKF